MSFNLRLQVLWQRLVLRAGLAVGGSLFLWWTLQNFVLEVVTDPRVRIAQETLVATTQYFPGAGRVQGRLAARLLESPPGEEQDEAMVLSQAERAAEKAAALLPWDYENHLLLATVKERKDDMAAAEKAMQTALQLAPRHVDVHWRAGNLLLRAEKLEQACQEFRFVAATDPSRAPQVLELVWAATEGNVSAIRQVAQNDPSLQLGAARFLLTKSETAEAVQLFSQADLQTRRSSGQSAAFLQALLAEHKILEAHTLWLDLMGNTPQASLLWNGGFETQPHAQFNQFDWVLTSSKYAQIGLSADRTHSGRLALKVIFAGEDTTRLADNITQLVAVRPGAKYQLDGYALTTDLVSTEPVNLVVKGITSTSTMATSAPIKAGGENWQPLRLEFVVPRAVSGIKIEIQRLPRFSYDAPTTGTIWFDDLSLKEL